jgi:hypothetical protein
MLVIGGIELGEHLAEALHGQIAFGVAPPTPNCIHVGLSRVVLEPEA